MDEGRLKLLKSLYLLDQIPDEQLAVLGEFLKPLELADGAVVFEEGSRGEGLYFVSSGQIRISKKIAGGKSKDLAVLGPGDCFGEMALVETIARSATATALGPTTAFELARADLDRFLKSNPTLAMGFFSELVQVQSVRLRRTSSELALLFDLSNLFLEPHRTAKDLLPKLLDRVTPHLEGNWSASAHLYNPFNEEMEAVAKTGPGDLAATACPVGSADSALWVDDQTFYVCLPGPKRPLGYLIFRRDAALSGEAKGEIARTLTTVGRLLSSAIENINYRAEDALRARLQQSNHGLAQF